MRLRPALVAALITVAIACWLGLPAQQHTPADADRDPIAPIFLDPTEVADIAAAISKRAAQLKPMFEEVHAEGWVAKGGPEAYISQWNSLRQQNDAIAADMTAITGHPEAMEDIIRALFRVHRFDGDVTGLLGGIRRYQSPALADRIESAAVNDQRGVEKLQQYVLNLANEKEKLLDVEDSEAQRCRSALASQPPARATTPKKTNGNSK